VNVLLTCAGRRSSLVRLFMAAVHPRGGLVLAGDASSLAPTLAIADRAVRLPLLSAEDYLDVLIRAIRENEVGLVVPTIDPELPLLAAARGRIEEAGARVLVSSTRFLGVCGDKWRTCQEFGERGIDVPASWLPAEFDPAEAPTDLFVKPRRGSSSRDVHAVDRDNLGTVLPQIDDPVIQERLSGPEITIDALFGLDDGTPLHYVPRERIRTLGGESIQGRTSDDADFREWLLRLMDVSKGLGARGPVTFQAFLTQRGPVLIEVNPRFGGGFPLGDAAGGHYPVWVVDMAEGRRVQPALGEYSRGVFMARYLVEHFTSDLPW